jgi:hypothetical protein
MAASRSGPSGLDITHSRRSRILLSVDIGVSAASGH